MNVSPTEVCPPDDDQDHQRQQLLTKIEAKYELLHRHVTMGDIEMEIIKVKDPDRILEEAVLAEERNDGSADPWEPYWAEAWDSAITLGARVARRALQGRHILDLGCGLGVAGCAAAAAGAERVMLGDYAPPSLDFARWNSWPWRDRVDVVHLNWKGDRFEEHRFDLILGADIQYERASWPYQEEFCRYHLAAGGEVWLAEPNRRLSDGFQQLFESRGWNVELSLIEPPESERRLRLFRCWLSK